MEIIIIIFGAVGLGCAVVGGILTAANYMDDSFRWGNGDSERKK